eukprot:TRINITY_DN6975_c0_g1_i1.p1 TRINITY_DN6975_c0_g1~~TRINITY_DN6975_c0_g1_i1.p1  ORF type:complete len:343 (+),score=23.41 TRINITY_DN6975_c0_g1_i1:254-1282(+)
MIPLDSVLVNQIIFLLTGIITTIGNQYVTYSGAASQGTLLPVAVTYYGMALAYFLPRDKIAPGLQQQDVALIPQSKAVMVKIIVFSFVDFLANGLGNFGIIYAGSGIYQVVHSAVVSFTAVWASVFLGKKLSLRQWGAIAIVTFGLLLSAIGSVRSEGPAHHDADSGHVVKGFLLTLLSTLLFSSIYCLAEHILTTVNAPSPQQLQTMAGGYCALIISTYLSIYTLPRYKELIVERVQDERGDVPMILLVYTILLLSAFGHAVTYFRLMGSVGAVSTGILQALRAVSVFFISAVLFCDKHSNQCFNKYKGLATLMVVLGILLFPSGKNNEAAQLKLEEVGEK